MIVVLKKQKTEAASCQSIKKSKESWRDEYLKWLCGYANAHGGTLFIGKDVFRDQ